MLYSNSESQIDDHHDDDHHDGHLCDHTYGVPNSNIVLGYIT